MSGFRQITGRRYAQLKCIDRYPSETGAKARKNLYTNSLTGASIKGSKKFPGRRLARKNI